MNETTPDQASAPDPAPDQLRLLGELLGCLDAAGYDPRDTQQLRLILAAYLLPHAGRPIPGPDEGDQARPTAPEEALLERLDTAVLIARSSLGTPSACRIRNLTSASQIAEIIRRRDQLAPPRQQPPAGPGKTRIRTTGPAAAHPAEDFRAPADEPSARPLAVHDGPVPHAHRHRRFRRGWLTATAAAAILLLAFLSGVLIGAVHHGQTFATTGTAVSRPAAAKPAPAAPQPTQLVVSHAHPVT